MMLLTRDLTQSMNLSGEEAMSVDGPDGLELTERLVAPVEMAQIMRVDEADVLDWIDSGELEVQRAADGEPQIPIRERQHRSSNGAASIEASFTSYRGPQDRQLLADAKAARRRRDREAEFAAAVAMGVDVDALTAALVQRLAAVAPPVMQIASDERGVLSVSDVRGGGATFDVALAVAFDEENARPPADRVVSAGQRLLEIAQDEIAEMTTDPWPRRGSGALPEPHAQLSEDGATVRLFYGDATNPALELTALSIADVLPSTSL